MKNRNWGNCRKLVESPLSDKIVLVVRIKDMKKIIGVGPLVACVGLLSPMLAQANVERADAQAKQILSAEHGDASYASPRTWGRFEYRVSQNWLILAQKGGGGKNLPTVYEDETEEINRLKQTGKPFRIKKRNPGAPGPTGGPASIDNPKYWPPNEEWRPRKKPSNPSQPAKKETSSSPPPEPSTKYGPQRAP